MEEPLHSLTDSDESPRISFSSEFLDESNFITICPNPQAEREREAELAIERARARGTVDFEFLSAGNLTNNMITADELISEGKLLPFWQIHHAEKLSMIALKSDGADEASREIEAMNKEEGRISWFIDDDPSPRPPKCTVLWKELLRLKKQRHPSTLSPSTSSSSSSSRISVADQDMASERKESNREKSSSKRIKKGQQERERERTRSSVSIRIRPVLTLNLPICTQAAKNAALPPLFAFRKGR